MELDKDIRSTQEVRDLVKKAKTAQLEFKHLKKQTMRYYEENLDVDTFFRVHRSYIVNINQIKQMELYEKESYRITLNNGSKIPVSRNGYGKIKEMLK